MSEIEIVHLSPTPLVCAPRKIAETCARLGAATTSIIDADYPGALAGIFTPGYLVWRHAHRNIRGLVVQKIADADVLHIHNDLAQAFAPYVAANTKAKLIYQVHSPKREGPLFVDRTEYGNLALAEKVVVGQMHPRMWPDYRPMPNIIDAAPTLRLIRDDETPRVLFSPAHNRGGRWNGKGSALQSRVLTGMARAGLIDLIELGGPLTPDNLLALRRTAHVTIDEVVTGGFHQVSLEGLCAGNVVVNGADHFSLAMFSQSIRADHSPPFLQASDRSLAETLGRLAFSKDLIRQYQRLSYDYYRQWLAPERLASFYMELYGNVLRNA